MTKTNEKMLLDMFVNYEENMDTMDVKNKGKNKIDAQYLYEYFNYMQTEDIMPASKTGKKIGMTENKAMSFLQPNYFSARRMTSIFKEIEKIGKNILIPEGLLGGRKIF